MGRTPPAAAYTTSAFDRWGSLSLVAVAVLVAVGSLGASLLGLSPMSPRTEGEERGTSVSVHPERLVVVELFTSQGCSSCPPADRVLSRLGSDPELADRVVPLSFHVDYWNRLGWRDPFSSPAWTQRQERYVRALRARSLYTPQMVVNGEREMVGSSETRVRDAIRRSLAEPPVGQLQVRLGDGQPEGGAGELPVTVIAELSTEPRPHDLVLVLFQTGLETDVPRGENAGRHLANDYVVRRLSRVARLTPDEPRFEDTLHLPLDANWEPGSFGVAAWLQDPKTLAIGGAAVAR